MKRVIALLLTAVLTMSAIAVPAYASDSVSLKISAQDKSHVISDRLYGSFIEDISYACDGGLVSNLVNNGSFEYEYDKLTAWRANDVEIKAESDAPISKTNTSYARVAAKKGGTLTNIGFTEMYDYKSYDRDEDKAARPDMGFEKGVKYHLSFYCKNVDYTGSVAVYLDSKTNRQQKSLISDITSSTTSWIQLQTELTSLASEDGGLSFDFNGDGTILIDFVTLIPENSYGYGTQEWKYTTLRPDLYQALKNMNPSFVRFPGGCLAEGDSLDRLYDWKQTIGPIEDRTQSYNLWRDEYGREYINTNAMGYHEYFQLCDDLNAQPLPILNAGLICQGRSGYDDYAAALEKLDMNDEQWTEYLVTKRGLKKDDKSAIDEYTKKVEGLNIGSRADFDAYLDTIALKPGTEEWESYVRDILDLVEYANGDATKTYWGALRAANGHEEPFNLEYIGIGNENWGEIYERNFKAIYKEIKKVHPDITIISSSGTWLEGEAYDYNWDWINKDYSDTVIDEHYYTGDGWMFSNNSRYDSFDRDKAHVFIGEYAATAKGVGTIQTKSNMLEAVEEASYLTGVERNGDVVDMASYAPTFAKVNAQCWNINLIWFDSREIVLTPSYYVQMLFANNYGTRYISSVFDNGTAQDNGVYESVTADEDSQTLYIKLVNTDGKPKNVNLSLDGYNVNKISLQSLKSSYKSACNEIGKNTTYPVQSDITAANEFTVEMDKYDVTVVRVAYGDNDGGSLYQLPKTIGTQSDNIIDYIPPVVKVGIPAAGGAAVFAAIAAVVIIIIKKKKQRKTDE